MKTKFKVLFSSMMMLLAIAFSACEGDQGEIGPKGDQGLQGEKGDKGDQGDKGDPGKDGDLEAASFGNIEITVSGIDDAGAEFTEVLDYKYLIDHDLAASVWTKPNGEETADRMFVVAREYKPSVPTNSRAESRGNVAMMVFGIVDGEYVLEQFDLEAAFISNNSVKWVSYRADDDDGETIFSNFSFDESTGKLHFEFTSTGVDYKDDPIEITGVADVNVYYAEYN